MNELYKNRIKTLVEADRLNDLADKIERIMHDPQKLKKLVDNMRSTAQSQLATLQVRGESARGFDYEADRAERIRRNRGEL